MVNVYLGGVMSPDWREKAPAIEGHNFMSPKPKAMYKTMLECVESDLEMIYKADLGFFWLPRLEAYGSCSEIGVCYGLMKPVYVAHPPSLDVSEYAFTLELASWVRTYVDPIAALCNALSVYRCCHTWEQEPWVGGYWFCVKCDRVAKKRGSNER